MSKCKKKTVCGLCLKIINDGNFKEIDSTTKEILNILLLKLDLKKKSSVICCPCLRKLHAAFTFKSICFYADDIIFPYVNSKEAIPVDLKEIYRDRINIAQSMNILENEKVCRLCLELIKEGYTPICDMEVDIVRIYIPEINLKVTSDPVICESCLTSLTDHGGFIKDCLEASKNLRSEAIELKHKETASEKSKGNSLQHDIDDGIEEISEVKKGTKQQHDGIEKKYRYKCKYCDYKHYYRGDVRKHMRKHAEVTDLPWYYCKECDYKSKYQVGLKSHILIHKNMSDVQLYKCDKCAYKTKYRQHFKTHSLVHKDPSQIEWYQCDKCKFKTKYSANLKSHKLQHKDSSETKMYKCDVCDFQTKHTKSIKMHEFTHKEDSEIQWYECGACTYKTKYRNSLKAHLQGHGLLPKSTSKGKRYKCEECEYEAQSPTQMKIHVIKHRDISEVKIYKCEICDFQSKYERGIQLHSKVHKDDSEAEWYECSRCNFRTRYKCSFTRHFGKHNNASQVKGSKNSKGAIKDVTQQNNA